MKHNKKLLGAALISGLLLSTAASAAVINLGASQDMTIMSNGRVDGAGQAIFAGQNGVGTNQRGMIQFDLTSLAGATINGVTLTMHVNAQPTLAVPETISLHTITSSWTESTAGSSGTTSLGGNGSPALPGDPTWASHSGEHNMTSSSSLLINSLGFVDFTGANLITDVQNWVNGGMNNGWMMIGNETSPGTVKRFSSRENIVANPVLTIDYTAAVVPVPAAVWLFGSGLIGLVGIARRRQR